VKCGTVAADPQLYWEARREHAWRLRMEGLTFRKIGKRLGVSGQQARILNCAHREQTA
jgi:hypothetical protein